LRRISLSMAANQIRQAVEFEEESPFFFVVGAGISWPPIPLASAIVTQCRREAQKFGRTVAGADEGNMASYSRWFEAAFPQRAMRQQYLRKLIQDQPISAANLRLAHLLIKTDIAKVVITPNFDDMLSRALALFGDQPIICDHPATIEKITGKGKSTQIVHVHGTYLFYDCCNLVDEIAGRAQRSVESNNSMGFFLDNLLTRKSPIVVGYSGWDKDVIMSALSRRLKQPLHYQVYWFCYSEAELASLPSWLTMNSDVVFVVPEMIDEARNNQACGPELDAIQREEKRTTRNPLVPALPATRVFETLIREFSVESPTIVSDPVQHLIETFTVSILDLQDDIYLFSDVISHLQRIRSLEHVAEESSERLRLQVLDRVRSARFGDAIELTGENIELFTKAQAEEIAELLTGILDNLDATPEWKLRGSDVILTMCDKLGRDNGNRVKALIQKGAALKLLGRPAEACETINSLLESPPSSQVLVETLILKAKCLIDMEKWEDALVVLKPLAVSPENTEEGYMEKLAEAAQLRANIFFYADDVAGIKEELGRLKELADIRDDASIVARLVLTYSCLGKQYAWLGDMSAAETVLQECLLQFGDRAEEPIRMAVADLLSYRYMNSLGRSDVETTARYCDEFLARAIEFKDMLKYPIALALWAKCDMAFDDENYAESIRLSDSLLSLFGGESDETIVQRTVLTQRLKALAYVRLGQGDSALSAIDNAVSRAEKVSHLHLDSLALALDGRADVLSHCQATVERRHTLERIISIGSCRGKKAKDAIARAYASLAEIESDDGNRDRAFRLVEELDERFTSSDDEVTLATVLNARLWMAQLLLKAGDSTDGLQQLRNVIIRCEAAERSDLGGILSKAVWYLAEEVARDDRTGAIKLYDLVREKCQGSAKLSSLTLWAMATARKAEMLLRMGDVGQAASTIGQITGDHLALLDDLPESFLDRIEHLHRSLGEVAATQAAQSGQGGAQAQEE